MNVANSQNKCRHADKLDVAFPGRLVAQALALFGIYKSTPVLRSRISFFFHNYAGICIIMSIQFLYEDGNGAVVDEYGRPEPMDYIVDEEQHGLETLSSYTQYCLHCLKTETTRQGPCR